MATATDPATNAGGRPAARRAPLPIAAVVAAVWAAVVSYAPLAAVAAVGSTGSGSTPGSVARLALAGWLLGQGVPLQTPSDQITLVPLAVTVLVAWRLVRAGIHSSRAFRGDRSRSLARPVVAATAVAVAYGALGFTAAVVVDGPELTMSPIRTAVTLGGVALVAAGLGAAGHSRARRHRAVRIPAWVPSALRGGVSTAALMIAGGAAVAGAALALRGGEATEVLGSYRAGIVGQAGMTLICLAYAPNLAIWAAAYLLGPGFGVGTDSIVSPADVLIGPVPAVPVLAGLPAAPVGGLGTALLALPPAASVCAGWLLGRRLRGSGCSASRVVAAGVLAGLVTGLLIHVAAVASAGSLGSGRLASVGPSGTSSGLAAAVTATAGVTIAALISHRIRRNTRRASR